VREGGGASPWGNKWQRCGWRGRAFFGDHLPQRKPGYVLEDRIQRAGSELARVDQPDDVRVRQGRTESHLAPEPVGLVLEIRRRVALVEAEDLHRYVLAGRQLPCAVDATEAPRADLAQDFVAVLEAHSRR